MDLRFLESLLSVVETGSIAAAARSQGLTAAAVSQRIRALEDQLGHPLFSRAGHRALPTEACLNALPRARRLVSEGRLLKSDLDETGLSGSFRLGAISSALSDLVPALVEHFLVQAPNAEIVVRPGPSQRLYEQIVREELDGAILAEPNFAIPKQIAVTRLLEQKLSLLHLGPADADPFQVVRDNPLIVYDRSSWGGNQAWKYVEDRRLNPTIRCEMDSLDTTAVLVAKGLGVAILPEWSGLRDRFGDLTITPLPGAEAYTRHIAFMAPRTTPLLRLQALCVEALT